jgi:hypothetical protein
VALGCLYVALAAAPATGPALALAAGEPTDALRPTRIVCLFGAHGACTPHRVVGTIAAWRSIQQCGIVSALSEPRAWLAPPARDELRTQPGLCQFFGDAPGDRPARFPAARTL